MATGMRKKLRGPVVLIIAAVAVVGWLLMLLSRHGRGPEQATPQTFVSGDSRSGGRVPEPAKEPRASAGLTAGQEDVRPPTEARPSMARDNPNRTALEGAAVAERSAAKPGGSAGPQSTAALETEITRLTALLSNRKAELAGLEDQIRKAQAAADQGRAALGQVIAERDRAASDAKSESNAARQSVRALEESAAQLKGQVAERTGELTGIDNQIRKAQAAAEQGRATLGQVTAEHDRAVSEAEAASNAARQSIRALEQSVAQLSGQISEKTTELAGLDNQIRKARAAAEQDHATLGPVTAEHDRAVSEAEAASNAARQSMQGLQGSRAQLTGQVSEKKAELAALQDQVAKAQASAEQGRAVTAAEPGGLASEAKSLQGGGVAQQPNPASEDSAVQVTAEMARRQAELPALQDQIAKAQAAAQQARNDLARILDQRDRAASEAKPQASTPGARTAGSSTPGAKQALEHTIAQLTGEISERKAELAAMKGRIARARAAAKQSHAASAGTITESAGRNAQRRGAWARSAQRATFRPVRSPSAPTWRVRPGSRTSRLRAEGSDRDPALRGSLGADPLLCPCVRSLRHRGSRACPFGGLPLVRKG